MKRCFLSILVIVVPLAGCGQREPGVNELAKQASEKRLQALEALDRQDWDTAVRLSSEAIQLEPKIVDAWWVRGLAHLKKKEHDKAEADCTEAIKLDADFAPAYRERGLALLGQKKHAQAIEDFTAYVKLRPEDPEGYQFRALAHSRNGDNKAASADLKQVDKLKAKK